MLKSLGLPVQVLQVLVAPVDAFYLENLETICNPALYGKRPWNRAGCRVEIELTLLNLFLGSSALKLQGSTVCPGLIERMPVDFGGIWCSQL